MYGSCACAKARWGWWLSSFNILLLCFLRQGLSLTLSVGWPTHQPSSGSFCLCPCSRALGTPSESQLSILLCTFCHGLYFFFVLVISCPLIFSVFIYLTILYFCIIFLVEIVTSIQVAELVSTFLSSDTRIINVVSAFFTDNLIVVYDGILKVLQILLHFIQGSRGFPILTTLIYFLFDLTSKILFPLT